MLHFAHVGANTGRDHFSGWSLDWLNLSLGYLPFLHRMYAPADARAAFIAVRDAAGAVSFVGHYDLALAAVADCTRLRLGLRISETAVAAVPFVAGIETGWGQVLDNLTAALSTGKERS